MFGCCERRASKLESTASEQLRHVWPFGEAAVALQQR
jgi:hypothetical protein